MNATMLGRGREYKTEMAITWKKSGSLSYDDVPLKAADHNCDTSWNYSTDKRKKAWVWFTFGLWHRVIRVARGTRIDAEFNVQVP